MEAAGDKTGESIKSDSSFRQAVHLTKGVGNMPLAYNRD